MENDNYFAFVLGLIFGLYLMVQSYLRYTKLSKVIENGVETRGLITAVKQDSRLINDEDDSSYQTVYYPVVEYTDEKGNELIYALEEEYSTSKNEYKVGEVLDLIYDREKPHIIVRKSTAEGRWIALLPLFLGAAAATYCGLMLSEYFSK